MRKPYYVYGGLQDNGSWGGPSQTRSLQTGITNADWYRVGGGDGFYTQIDPTDHNIVYAESQGGAMQRLDLRTGRSVSIRPRGVPQTRGGQGETGRRHRAASPSPGARLRQRQTPQPNSPLLRPRRASVVLAAQTCSRMWSRHHQRLRVLSLLLEHAASSFAAQSARCLRRRKQSFPIVGPRRYLDRDDRSHKQIDRNTLPIMGVPGKDPMASKHDGYTGYGYIVTVAESPKVPGVLWVGTDDGNIQVSRDGGATWTNVSKNVPGIGETYHISRVEPSHFDAGTCYLAVDGHRLDDLKPYLFVTRDYGATWTSIVNNLPKWGTVNVVRRRREEQRPAVCRN